MSPISICLHVLTTIYKVQFFGCSWNYRSNNTYIDVYRYYFSMPVIELFRLIRLHGSLIKSDMPKGMHVSHRHFVSYQKYSLLCVYREGRWEFFYMKQLFAHCCPNFERNWQDFLTKGRSNPQNLLLDTPLLVYICTNATQSKGTD